MHIQRCRSDEQAGVRRHIGPRQRQAGGWKAEFEATYLFIKKVQSLIVALTDGSLHARGAAVHRLLSQEPCFYLAAPKLRMVE